MSDVDIRKKTGKQSLWMTGMVVVALLWILAARENAKEGSILGNAFRESIQEALQNAIYEQFLPVVTWEKENTQTPYILQKQMTDIMPFYGYALEHGEAAESVAEDVAGGNLAADDVTGDNSVTEDVAEGTAGNRVLVQVPPENLTQTDPLTQSENSTQSESPIQSESAMDPQGDIRLDEGEVAETIEPVDMAEPAELVEHSDMTEPADMSAMSDEIFHPNTLQNPIDMAEYADYESLVKQFYTIDSSTMAGKDQLNAEKLTDIDLTLEKKEDGPQVLIYHTHSQEAFADSVPGDVSTSIVGVGEELTQILQEDYGYSVLHHTGQYDLDSRNDAYSLSLPAIEQILEEYPTIEVIIDLHRDQMPEETRLVMDVNGRPTARFMFFNGLSRTRSTGNIAYLKNEYQEENLAFSFQMHLATEQYYPGLARKIYLKGYRYNMHLKPRSLLIELGAQNNTVEEAMNACGPIAHMLDMVLRGEN